MYVFVVVCMWRSEGNQQEFILSVHHAAAGIKLGSSGLAASTFTSGAMEPSGQAGNVLKHIINLYEIIVHYIGMEE